MATVNLRSTAVKSTPQWDGIRKSGVMKFKVDLSGVAVTANDMFQIATLPANLLVKGATVKVTKAAVGTSGTMNCGWGTAYNDATQNDLGAAQDIKTVANVWTVNATAGGLLTAGTEILCLVSAAATAITAGPVMEILLDVTDMS